MSTTRERLYDLMDKGAPQGEINERTAASLVEVRAGLSQLEQLCEKITSDHEKRIRAMERLIGFGVGALGLLSLVMQVAMKFIH